MKIAIKLILISYLITAAQVAHSQKSAYIENDTTIFAGIKLLEGTSMDNAKFIRMIQKGVEVKYYPHQILGYGFKNGAIYKSKTISIEGQTKRAFLERVEGGKINLYFYTKKGVKTYFIERDSTVFVEINKRNFQEELLKHTNDFNWEENEIQLVRYNRNSLAKMVYIYNNDLNKPLSFPRFGIIAFYNIASLVVPSDLSNTELSEVSFSSSSSLSIGVFGDLPIGMGDFSLNVGLNLLKSAFSGNSKSSQSELDILINSTSISTPILFRYTIPTFFWRPFCNIGGVYSYHLRSDTNTYESLFDQNVVIIKKIDQKPLISTNMLGYSLGLGIQRKLNYKKIISLELRYNQMYGSKQMFNSNHIQFLTSFSF